MRTPRRGTRVLLPGLVVASLLGGCSGDEGIETQEHGGTTALVERRTDGGMDAAIGGELVRGQGGCLAMQSAETQNVIIWPEESQLHSDGQSIDVGDVTIRIGDTFSGGGGFIGDPAGSGYEIPTSCRNEGEVVVIASVTVTSPAS